MYESFISDLNIFSNEFSSFIDTSDRPAILYKIQQKHIGELEDDLNIEDKKIDYSYIQFGAWRTEDEIKQVIAALKKIFVINN